MEFPTYAQLQERRTMKWTRYPEDVIPLWVAESDFVTCPPVKAALADAVERESFGYQPDGSQLPQAVAEFYQQRFGFAARPEWIHALPDVVRGVYLSVEHYTPAGSPVIVPTPAYPPFFGVLQATGREGIFVEASTEHGISLEDVEAGFKAGARSIILANPFNPLGLVFDAEWLRELCHLAQRYEARVISDEIHAPLVFDGQHVVAAGIDEVCAKVCITITATSKAWNTAGLKCAQIIFSNAEDNATWESLSPVLKDGVSTLGLIGAEVSYREGGDFLDEELKYLKANRDYLVETLPKVIPGVKVTAPAATYLLWVDCSDTAISGSPSEFFLNEAKVMLNDGIWFGPQYAHACRLNFATSREILEDAVARIAAAVAKL